MKEIIHHKFSLFLVEDIFGEECFRYIDTFNTLEEAQEEQSKDNMKSIILPSY